MKKGIMIKPAKMPSRIMKILQQTDLTFDCKMYGNMIGLKPMRKKGKRSITRMIIPITLSIDVHVPLYSCNSILF